MQSHLGVQFKPAVGRKEHNAWRTEWIFRRQPDPKVIQSPLEIGSRRPTEGAVPFLKPTFIAYEQCGHTVTIQRDGEIRTKMSS